MGLSFSEQPETGLVAVTLTDAEGREVQTRVVTSEELAGIARAARLAVARAQERGEPLFVTLDELIDGPDT